MNDLLGLVNGLILQMQSCRISMAQGNNRISDKSPIEVPALIE